jgi:lipopolysaccharide biosynthesis regulator YciM
VGGALAVALMAGAVGGHGSARARVEEDRARLASAYVAGLDARLMTPVR